VPTCCGLVGAPRLQQVVVMEFGKQHDTTDFSRATCYNLQTYYGETGVMDFGVYACSPVVKLRIFTPFDDRLLSTSDRNELNSSE